MALSLFRICFNIYVFLPDPTDVNLMQLQDYLDTNK